MAVLRVSAQGCFECRDKMILDAITIGLKQAFEALESPISSGICSLTWVFLRATSISCIPLYMRYQSSAHQQASLWEPCSKHFSLQDLSANAISAGSCAGAIDTRRSRSECSWWGNGSPASIWKKKPGGSSLQSYDSPCAWDSQLLVCINNGCECIRAVSAADSLVALCLPSSWFDAENISLVQEILLLAASSHQLYIIRSFIHYSKILVLVSLYKAHGGLVLCSLSSSFGGCLLSVANVSILQLKCNVGHCNACQRDCAQHQGS